MSKQTEFFHPDGSIVEATEETPKPRKYLARNVPSNFIECCEHIRAEHRPRPNSRPIDYDRQYRSLLNTLLDSRRPENLVEQIGQEIFEVQVRFEAIQRTIDFNISATPIFNRLRKLKRHAATAAASLHDEERDKNIRVYTGIGADEPLPRTMEEFLRAQSIAEKASIAGRLIEDFEADLDSLVKFFDYKRGLVTTGQPSVYAVLYAVAALADIFENYNHERRKAYVTQVDLVEERKGKIKYRYEGPFLDFVEQFFFLVDFAEIERNSRSGLHDRVRKFAAKRKKDPDFFRLLHQENVSPEAVLEFMKRADAIK